MKRGLSLIFVSMLAIAFCLVGTGCSRSDMEKGESIVDSVIDEATKLGDYSVKIESCRRAKDFEGKDVVIVKYLFSNNNDDNSAAFYLSFDDTVYQNGVGLNESYVLEESANYDSDAHMKEVKKGSSIEIERAYELNDTETDRSRG